MDLTGPLAFQGVVIEPNESVVAARQAASS
jgi:hypothetical protein